MNAFKYSQRKETIISTQWRDFNWSPSSDICSPLTEVEPDYSTDNSDDDDDDESVRVGGGVGHDAGNIYEQVKEVKKKWGGIHVMSWEGFLNGDWALDTVDSVLWGHLDSCDHHAFLLAVVALK